MLLNLKPYIDVKNNGKAQSYTLGISTDKSYIDQKRDVIDVMPGYQIVVKVIPQVVGASSLFAEMDQSSRKDVILQILIPFDENFLFLGVILSRVEIHTILQNVPIGRFLN